METEKQAVQIKLIGDGSMTDLEGNDVDEFPLDGVWEENETRNDVECGVIKVAGQVPLSVLNHVEYVELPDGRFVNVVESERMGFIATFIYIEA